MALLQKISILSTQYPSLPSKAYNDQAAYYVGKNHIKGVKPLLITANGHGTCQMCRTDKYGFPSRYVPRFKFVKGFQTEDMVKSVVTNGKKTGVYVGRVAIRSTGSFNISTDTGLIQGISYKYCQTIHKKDGYSDAA